MRKTTGTVLYAANYVEIRIIGLTESEGKRAIESFRAAYCDDSEDCTASHIGMNRMTRELITLFTIRHENESQAAIYLFAAMIAAHLHKLVPFFEREIVPVLRAGQACSAEFQRH